jgi:hypothetical protein
MKEIFVRLTAIALTATLLPVAAQAAPAVTGVVLFTENRGATSVFSAGHSFLLVANASPSGPGTTVTGTHVPGGSGPDYAMSHFPGAGGFLPNQYAIRTPYTGQTGRWDVTATDGTGSTTVRTHNLDDVRVLPLVTGLTASGSVLTPHLSWDPVDPAMFPSFCGGAPYGACSPGYDFFQYQVEVRQVSGDPSNPAPLAYSSTVNLYTSTPGTLTPDLTMTQFDIPVGVLSYGNHYLIGIRLNHFELEGAFPAILENRSTNYIEVTPVPEPETYAMLLAGLGLLGFVARRRRQREAALA